MDIRQKIKISRFSRTGFVVLLTVECVGQVSCEGHKRTCQAQKSSKHRADTTYASLMTVNKVRVPRLLEETVLTLDLHFRMLAKNKGFEQT